MSTESIKQTALHLFEKFSYSKTSVSDIARACGIGKGSMYLHFRSKEELLFSISQDRLNELRTKHDALDEKDAHKRIKFFALGLVDEFFYLKNLMFGDYVDHNTAELRGLFEKAQSLISWGIKNLTEIAGLGDNYLEVSHNFLTAILGLLVLLTITEQIKDEKKIKTHIEEQIEFLIRAYFRRNV